MSMSKKEFKKVLKENPNLAEAYTKKSSKRNRSMSNASKSSSSSRGKGGLFGGLFGGLKGLGGGIDFNSIRSKVTETNQFLQELNSALSTADHIRHQLGPLMKNVNVKEGKESTNQLPVNVRRGEKPPRLS